MKACYEPQDRAYIVRVRGVTNARAIGYVTKYLTKEVALERRGMRLVEQQRLVYRMDDEGQLRREPTTRLIEVMSRARRIRYTQHFFPASTAALRARIFADLGQGEVALSPGGLVPDVADEAPEEEPQASRGSWVLYEKAPYSDDLNDYYDRRREALVEALQRQQDGERLYSGRIVNMWAAQQRLQREDGSS